MDVAGESIRLATHPQQQLQQHELSRTTSNSSDAFSHQRVSHETQTPEYVQRRVLWLLLAMSFALIVFVLVPVVISFPYIDEPWFDLADLWKMMDLLVSVPLNYFILVHASLFRRRHVSKRPMTFKPCSERTSIMWLFQMAIAVYCLGQVAHTVSVMFKHPLNVYITTYSMTLSPDQLKDVEAIYKYVRNDWQKVYSHYIYAFGLVCISVLHVVAYRHDRNHLKSRPDSILFWSSSIMYGIMVAATAIEFPKGPIVGFVWCLIYIPFLFWISVRRNDAWKSIGSRLVPHFYAASYVFGFCGLLIWIFINGFKSREDVGIKL